MGSGQLCTISKYQARNAFDNRLTTEGRDTSLSHKADCLAQGLKDMVLQECTNTDVDHISILRHNLVIHCDTFQTPLIEMARKEELTNARFKALEATNDDLEARLKSAQEERKKVAQELKHAESERLKANERFRNAEDKWKKAMERGDAERKGAELERGIARQLQKRIEDLQRKAILARCCDEGTAKKTKEVTPDVSGLQRGLERVKGQLKKKQDEFQAQAQVLNQTTAKVKNLELSAAEDCKRMVHLQNEIQRLQTQMEEERTQMRSESLAMKLRECKNARMVEIEKDKYAHLEMLGHAERIQLNRLFHSEEDKNKKLDEKVNRLESRLSDIEDNVNYEPFGDADIADRIRIRNLVDQVQERLATKAGLTPSGSGECLSLTWRLALGTSTDDTYRIQRARELLAGKDIDEYDHAFINNDRAMRHVCQYFSRFRKPGNELHQILDRDGYMMSVQRYLRFNPTETAGDTLVTMVNYVCCDFASPIY